MSKKKSFTETGNKWHPGDVDDLIERYLNGESLSKLSTRFQRSESALLLKLYKVCIGYVKAGSSFRLYKPSDERKTRDGKPLKLREQQLLETWRTGRCQFEPGFASGISYLASKGKVDFSVYDKMRLPITHISGVLARSAKEVETLVAPKHSSKPASSTFFAVKKKIERKKRAYKKN